MTSPARHPVDDALDRLEGCITRVKDGTIIVGRTSEEDADAALATVRSALEQLREERDAAVDAIKTATDYWPGYAHRGKAYYALNDALAEVGQK